MRPNRLRHLFLTAVLMGSAPVLRGHSDPQGNTLGAPSSGETTGGVALEALEDLSGRRLLLLATGRPLGLGDKRPDGQQSPSNGVFPPSSAAGEPTALDLPSSPRSSPHHVVGLSLSGGTWVLDGRNANVAVAVSVSPVPRLSLLAEIEVGRLFEPGGYSSARTLGLKLGRPSKGGVAPYLIGGWGAAGMQRGLKGLPSTSERLLFLGGGVEKRISDRAFLFGEIRLGVAANGEGAALLFPAKVGVRIGL